jgi:GrpB-like predicted nucleotidyltransferase (UPF0157 family)
VDEQLISKLRTVGLDPEAFGDAAPAWRRLHDRYGTRATLLDRYAMEAVVRGIAVEDLPADVRAELTLEVTRAHWSDFQIVRGSDRSVVDRIEVIDYDPTWSIQFEAWRDRLVPVLGANLVRIEHVGSTSVPGLAAKPIVDIQLSMANVQDESTYVPAIEALGVALRSRDSDHRYFRPAGDLKRVVQIHVCQAGSPWERTHVLFRDYLRSHPEAAQSYADLKRASAGRYPEDRIAYNESKTDFILDQIERAEEWAAQTSWTLS